jgi:hypothetical protein
MTAKPCASLPLHPAGLWRSGPARPARHWLLTGAATTTLSLSLAMQSLRATWHSRVRQRAAVGAAVWHSCNRHVQTNACLVACMVATADGISAVLGSAAVCWALQQGCSCAWGLCTCLAACAKLVPLTAAGCWCCSCACAGIGWTDDTVQRRGSQVVDALHPAGTGIIEYEVRLLPDITATCLPAALLGFSQHSVCCGALSRAAAAAAPRWRLLITPAFGGRRCYQRQ